MNYDRSYCICHTASELKAKILSFLQKKKQAFSEGDTHSTAASTARAWFQQEEQKFTASFSVWCHLEHSGGCCISYCTPAWIEQTPFNLNTISDHPTKLRTCCALKKPIFLHFLQLKYFLRGQKDPVGTLER